MTERPLTAMQQAFCLEYLAELARSGRPNQTAAAIAAGYSKKSARDTASRMMHNPRIHARIEEAISQSLLDRYATGDRIIGEVVSLAFTRMDQVVRWHPDHGITLMPSADLPEEVLAAVKKIKCETIEIPREDKEPITKHRWEIELHSKQAALDRLGEMKALWGRSVWEGGGGAGIPIEGEFRGVALMEREPEPVHPTQGAPSADATHPDTEGAGGDPDSPLPVG